MDSLLAKEAADQWSIEHDIDWQLPIRTPIWFRRRTYIKAISQFYHGERATQRVCNRLLDEIDDPMARQFLAYQLADEEKHEAVFTRYIQCLGDIAPFEPGLNDALEGSLAWQGSKLGSPIGLIISFHIVFEGGALLLLERLARRFPCPLFRRINAKVMADEARHVAFGYKFVRENLPKISHEERLAIFAHVARVWRNFAKASDGRYNLGIALVMRISSNWFDDNWQRQKNQLIKLGLVTDVEAASIEATLR